MRRLTGVLIILVVAAGCGSGGTADVEVLDEDVDVLPRPDGDAPTDPTADLVYDSAFLAQVAETTSAVSSYQFVTTVESYMAEGGRVLIDSRGADSTVATFVDGRSSASIDLYAALGHPGAAVKELVSDEASLFIRIDTSLDIDPRDDPDAGFLWEQPGTWMFADMASLLEHVDGTQAAEVWQAAGAGAGHDPWVDILRSSGNVTEEGETVLDGLPVTHLAVASSLGALYAAQGMDADAMFGSLVPGVDLGNATTRVDLYVDETGVLRRMEMTMTEENLAGLIDQPLGSFDFLLHMVQDITRVGDPELTVELPPLEGSRDVTDEYGDLLAATVLR